jgi:hypothetical protein
LDSVGEVEGCDITTLDRRSTPADEGVYGIGKVSFYKRTIELKLPVREY